MILARSIMGCLIVVGLVGCSVEAGKMPESNRKMTSERVEQARSKIKSDLTDLQSSISLFQKAQTVIQRGLTDRNIDSGDSVSAAPTSLMVPSDADGLTFNEDEPDKFEYRLNNSTSVSMKTKTGGKIDVVLKGTLEQAGSQYHIKDAKLEVKYEKDTAKQKFVILAQQSTNQSGQVVTEWSVDFRELNSLYIAMTGETTASLLNGSLTFKLSDKDMTVNGKDFSMGRQDVAVTLETIDIALSKDPSKPRKIVISGHVEKENHRIGTFSLNHQNANSQSEMTVDFKF